MKDLFLKLTSIEAHLEGMKSNYSKYCATMLVLLNQGFNFPDSNRVHMLVAALYQSDRELWYFMMVERDEWGVVELVKAIKILDGNRKRRQINKTLEKLSSKSRSKKYKEKQLELSTIPQNAFGSFPGSKQKYVRDWVATISPAELEWQLINYDVTWWQELADFVHLNPAHFQLDWFLKVVYGEPAPEDSFTFKVKHLDTSQIDEFLQQFPLPYRFVRRSIQTKLSNKSKDFFLSSETLSDSLLYVSELLTPNSDDILSSRIDKEWNNDLGFAELVYRILQIQQHLPNTAGKAAELARKTLDALSLDVKPPVVVMGDASGSMEVAIQLSSILAGMISVKAKADLIFFDHEIMDSPVKHPSTVGDIIKVASMKSRGATAPAAALWPYFAKKDSVKTIFMISDELENRDFRGYYFDRLLEEYYNTVAQPDVIFVSFRDPRYWQPQMANRITQKKIPFSQYFLDKGDPDLRKIDEIFYRISTEMGHFGVQVNSVSEELEKRSLMEIQEILKKTEINAFTLGVELVTLKDWAMLGLQKPDEFIVQLSRTKSIAQSCQKTEMVELLHTWIKRTAELRDKSLSPDFFKDLILQCELWEIELQQN